MSVGSWKLVSCPAPFLHPLRKGSGQQVVLLVVVVLTEEEEQEEAEEDGLMDLVAAVVE